MLVSWFILLPMYFIHSLGTITFYSSSPELSFPWFILNSVSRRGAGNMPSKNSYCLQFAGKEPLVLLLKTDTGGASQSGRRYPVQTCRATSASRTGVLQALQRARCHTSELGRERRVKHLDRQMCHLPPILLDFYFSIVLSSIS